MVALVPRSTTGYFLRPLRGRISDVIPGAWNESITESKKTQPETSGHLSANPVNQIILENNNYRPIPSDFSGDRRLRNYGRFRPKIARCLASHALANTARVP